MNTEFIIGIVVTILIIWIFIASRKHHLKHIEKVKEEKLDQKKVWSQETILNYHELQKKKEELINLIDKQLVDYAEPAAQLKEIINEWVELKIKTFRERRSWVRKPKEK